jgi:hypothetical protein
MSVMKCHVGDLKKSSTPWNGLLLLLVSVDDEVLAAAAMIQ